MTSKILASLVAIFALTFFVGFASAAVQVNNELVTVTALEVSGVDILNDNAPVAEFTGDTIPVRVQFNADSLGSESVSKDVRVKAWVSGESTNAAVTERFDVLAGRTYTRLLSIPMPSTLKETNKTVKINVIIEGSDDGELASVQADVTAQRSSYSLDVLDANFNSEVKAGEVLAVDVVLKNRGSHFADDSFVKVRIPALGIETRGYFGDLSPVDQSNPDKEDANERRLFLNIPDNAQAGIYPMEIEAYNGDSDLVITRKVVINGAGSDSIVVSPVESKSFAVGSSVDYSMTLVNSGNSIKVYEFVVDAVDGLSLNLDEPIVAVPAGTSKTVKLTATASKAGSYNFAVNVHSGTSLVKQQKFTANVSGSTITAGNATVLLTVILAIVFIVLLVVLVVLLTRKPQKSEEFGESYY